MVIVGVTTEPGPTVTPGPLPPPTPSVFDSVTTEVTPGGKTVDPGSVLMMTDPTKVCVKVEMLVTPGRVTGTDTVDNCVFPATVVI